MLFFWPKKRPSPELFIKNDSFCALVFEGASWGWSLRKTSGHRPNKLKGLLGSVISRVITPISRFTLPETNSLHMKMDGWNTIVSFWDDSFSGARLVSGSEKFPVIHL